MNGAVVFASFFLLFAIAMFIYFKEFQKGTAIEQ